MTHKELIKVARKWLRECAKCKVILTERGSSTGYEIPDAIGWKSARYSILIECKASRADFRQDAKKWFRQEANLGMGQQRYFLAPEGVIPKDEVPQGWGLLELSGKFVKSTIVCDLVYFDERRCWAEMPLIIAAMRRLQLENKNIKRKLRTLRG